MPAEQSDAAVGRQFLSQLTVPIFILQTFFPSAAPKIAQWFAQHPRVVRFLSLPVALWVFYETLSGKMSTLWLNLTSTFMSSIKISGKDSELYGSLQVFLSTKTLIMNERNLSAASSRHLRNYGYKQYDQRLHHNDIVFEATNKFQFFWHEHRLFVVTQDKACETSQVPGNITIRTFGWSPDPILKMLSHARTSNIEEQGKISTDIYVPQDKCRSWQLRCSKASRPLTSVYLPQNQKEVLISDIAEYLHEDTVRWHEENGVQHRRGYLFSGPPGTGKSTLAMAIAGHFQLNVFILSLLDSQLDDSTLLALMRSVGTGTLLLLEDVDCSGLGRRSIKSGESEHDTKGKVVTKQSSGVSLSGLLNALDGGAAPEGHVLIMTTNCPMSLDDALVRAGRVDVQVPFANADRGQIRDIFRNMYTRARDEPEKEEKIKEFAEEFAGKVPEGEFSPAQLQGYIILHKKDPAAAVAGVEEWVKETGG